MRALSIPQMVELEQDLFKKGTYTAEGLMKIVGYALARLVVEEYPQATEYLIFVGKGNNGGDGLVMARALAEMSKRRSAVPLRITVYQVYRAEDDLGPLSGFPEVQVIHEGPIPFPGSDGVVVDALLGVQAKGPLRPPLAGLVAEINRERRARFFRTVAVDLPSGLGAYPSEPDVPEQDACIVADITATAGYAKTVLCREALSGWVGRLVVLPWKPDSEEPRRNAETPEVLVPFEMAALLPRRNALSYKGTYGHLLIVAGSPGFSGAAVLCSQAALAMGAGLISVLTENWTTAASYHPGQIVKGRSESIEAGWESPNRTGEGFLTVASENPTLAMPPEVMVTHWNKVSPELWPKFTVAAFGPGTGTGGDAINRLNRIIHLGIPLVIDADGLNILSRRKDLLNLLIGAKAPVILTPHKGEMTRLRGDKFGVDGREWVAREFVERYRVTLVLKGTRTIVTGPGEPIFYNTTGNPGLSVGGSGDTLTGIIGALLAQGLSGLDAARLGVWLHGHAADLLLRERGCEEGMTPTQLAGKLGQALVSLRAQAVIK